MTTTRRTTISPHPLEMLMRGGALALAGLAVASCAGVQRAPQQPPAQQAVPPAAPAAGDAGGEAEIGVLPPEGGVVVQTAAQTAVAQVQRDGRVPQIGRSSEPVPRVQVQGDNTIALNLEQEDLRRVFEQLGSALNLNMIIDPAINAVASVRTTEDNPLTYDDIWPLMRMLARSAGVAIEQSGDYWRFYVAPQERVPTQIVMPNFLGQTTASEVLQVTPVRPPVQMSATVNSITYRANGFTTAAAFTVCMPTTYPRQNQRVLSVTAAGKVSTTKADGSGSCS